MSITKIHKIISKTVTSPRNLLFKGFRFLLIAAFDLLGFINSLLVNFHIFSMSGIAASFTVSAGDCTPTEKLSETRHLQRPRHTIYTLKSLCPSPIFLRFSATRFLTFSFGILLISFSITLAPISFVESDA